MNENDYLNFKYLLEYFVSHLEWIVNNDTSFIGYKKYIEPRLQKNEFKITGQGYNGGRIQEQIADWDHFEGTKVCINITYNQMIGYHSKFCYLNWLWTGVNIIAEWEDKRIVGLYQELFIERKKPEKSIWKSLNMSKSLQELGLFDNSSTTNSVLKSFYKNFREELLQHNLRELQNKKMAEIEDKIKLVKYKKQIILQGPPGTGKTREAKLIAKEIIGKTIDDKHILSTFKVGQKIKTPSGNKSYEIVEINTGLKKIKLKRESETEDYITFKEIIEAYNNKLWNISLEQNNPRRAASLAKYLYDNLLEDIEQFKLIQFHPSYTYEDFVRGIIVTTDDGVAEYKTLNKILGDFARRANQSNLTGGVDDFERAWSQLVEDINEKKVTKIGTSNVNVEINSQGNIKFASPVATFEKTYELYKFGKTDLKYETYQKIVLNYLKNPEGLYKLQDYVAPQETQSDKPYVLVIDEINRANLSSVLGELIYALEYRGQTVESIYSTLEDGHSLVLPNNLYVIGTMNTADRSVGHIDYAIRRRFAFVDVLPKDLKSEMEDGEFYTDLFNAVKALFTKDDYQTKSDFISQEFEPKDVALGHSYFINKSEEGGDMKIRWNYEIKPILLEYLRDGILKIDALKQIDDIENTFTLKIQ